MHPDDSKSYKNVESKKLFRHGRWRCAKVPSFRSGNRYFAQGRQVSGIADHTNAELADMHLVNGAADCSGSVSQHLYAERYPTRRIPSHNFFTSLHRTLTETSDLGFLAETGSFQRAGRERVRIARTPAVEQNVLH